MAKLEDQQRPHFFENLVGKGIRIENPSACKPKRLQALIASQMLYGGEIIIKSADEKGIIVPEETLIEAIALPSDQLRRLLESMTKAMLDSQEIIFKKGPKTSIN